MTNNQALFEDDLAPGEFPGMGDEFGTLDGELPNTDLGEGAMDDTPPAKKPVQNPSSLEAIKGSAVKEVSTLLGGKTPGVKDYPKTFDEVIGQGRTGVMDLPYEATPTSPIPDALTNEDPLLGALGSRPKTSDAYPGLGKDYGVVEDPAFYNAPGSLSTGDPLLYGILGNYNKDAKRKQDKYRADVKGYQAWRRESDNPGLHSSTPVVKHKPVEDFAGPANQEMAQKLMAIPPALKSSGRLFQLWNQAERRQGREGAAGIKTMEQYYEVADSLSQKYYQKPLDSFLKDRSTPEDEAAAKSLNQVLRPGPTFTGDANPTKEGALQEEKPALSKDLKGYEDYLPGGEHADGGIKDAIKAKYSDEVWGRMTQNDKNQAIKGLVDEKKASSNEAGLTKRLREGRTVGPDAVRMTREYKDSILPEVFKASKLGGGAGPAAAAEHSRKLRQFGALSKKYSPELATQYMTNPEALKKSDPEAFAAAQKLVGPVKGAGVSSDSTGGVSNALDSIQDKIASGKGHNGLRALGSGVQQLQQLMGEKGISDFSSLPPSLQRVSTFLRKELNPLIKRIGGAAVNNKKNLNNAIAQRTAQRKATMDRENVRATREKAKLERQKFQLSYAKATNDAQREKLAQEFYQKQQVAQFQWKAQRGIAKDALSREKMQAKHAAEVAKSKRSNAKILADSRKDIASAFQKMISNDKAMELLSDQGSVVNKAISEYYSKYAQFPGGLGKLIRSLPTSATAADRAIIRTYILGEAASTPLRQRKRVSKN